jgi:uncharacterized protein (TIGR02265 family)
MQSATQVSEEIVFNNIVDGLFNKALGAELSPSCREKLHGAGLDLSRKLLPGYPRAQWLQFLKIAAAEFYPDKPLEPALMALGRRLSVALTNDLIGKALSPMMLLIGPRRTLARTKQNLRNGNNFSLAEVKELSPTSSQVWLNEPGPARAFMQGVFQFILEKSGAKDVKIEIVDSDARGTTYKVSWT